MDWEAYGIKIDDTRLNNLSFADDIVLIGDGREEIQKMMRELIRASGEEFWEVVLREVPTKKATNQNKKKHPSWFTPK